MDMDNLSLSSEANVMSVSRSLPAVDETMRCGAAFDLRWRGMLQGGPGPAILRDKPRKKGRVGVRVRRLTQMMADEEQELRALLERLKQEHRDLDVAIAALQGMPGNDQLQLARFKKRKLLLKDRIGYVEDQICPDIIA